MSVATSTTSGGQELNIQSTGNWLNGRGNAMTTIGEGTFTMKVNFDSTDASSDLAVCGATDPEVADRITPSALVGHLAQIHPRHLPSVTPTGQLEPSTVFGYYEELSPVIRQDIGRLEKSFGDETITATRPFLSTRGYVVCGDCLPWDDVTLNDVEYETVRSESGISLLMKDTAAPGEVEIRLRGQKPQSCLWHIHCGRLTTIHLRMVTNLEEICLKIVLRD
ncbi:hypothetical protein BXZ70DRAFT_907025 [Cristinia sonorae]|uniref:Uncharacterized protein n=1 Tax=Cristinia sonorae TaxID=1940300 RepID=A0A8K0XQ01_9AGAR|nr:hypothetical protein BXZ70DRAFT_907025 [Cristinia sonorae]